ncbi:MAG: hypothetical protein A2381_14730 [Bdellovibrionales bacterium RIFOXYB1_FULL_37_110]|nr:MAG: hypothetical protein A2381_14730 [Bdellovibrionales bacterium RIFOXYB1_FULL_37_110]
MIEAVNKVINRIVNKGECLEEDIALKYIREEFSKEYTFKNLEKKKFDMLYNSLSLGILKFKLGEMKYILNNLKIKSK